MAYYLRFTTNPQADLERGYSFHLYLLFDSKRDAAEWRADQEEVIEKYDCDLDAYLEDHDEIFDLIGQDNITGKWGFVRSGLCGFGPYDSIEEAEGDVSEIVEKFGLQYNSGTIAIYEGIDTWNLELDELDEGTTFRPVALIKEIAS